MSLELSFTEPKGTVAFSRCDKKVTLVSEGRQLLTIKMNMDDFCELVRYVLTNTDLEEEDPRRVLVAQIERMAIVEGFNGHGSSRLMFDPT